MFIKSSQPEEIDWEKEPDLDEFRRLVELSKFEPQSAVAGFEKLAERNSIASMLHLASGYMLGTPAKDSDKAKYWYSLASSQGHKNASMTYGHLCYDSKDYPTAKIAFERAAHSGDPEAIYFLGLTHLKGKRNGLSRAQGISLLDRSSKLGFPFATRDLAILMITGRLGFSNWVNGVPMLFRSILQTRNIFQSTKRD